MDTLHHLFRLSMPQVEMILDQARTEGWEYDSSIVNTGHRPNTHWTGTRTIYNKAEIQATLDAIAIEIGAHKLVLAKSNRVYVARYNRDDGPVCPRVEILSKGHSGTVVFLDGRKWG